MSKHLYIILILLLVSSVVSSQEEVDTFSGKIRFFEFNFGQTIPYGDMGDRFGRYTSIGSSVGLLYNNNLHVELKGNILYGRSIKEDVLENLRNDEGIITGADGIDALIYLRMRGGHIGVTLNKIIPISKESRSGLKLGLGAGLLWHKVRLQDDSRSVLQLLSDYEYGYDRLTAGFTFNQFIGYQILSKNQTMNFVFGFDLFESFSKNIRPFNFTGSQEFHNSSRLDLGIGLKIGFMMTFYTFDKPEEIFY